MNDAQWVSLISAFTAAFACLAIAWWKSSDTAYQIQNQIWLWWHAKHGKICDIPGYHRVHGYQCTVCLARRDAYR